MNRIFIICGVSFFVVISGMALLSKSVSDSKATILPAPSHEFDNWRKEWEKQR